MSNGARIDLTELEHLVSLWEAEFGYDEMRDRLYQLAEHRQFTYSAAAMVNAILIAY